MSGQADRQTDRQTGSQPARPIIPCRSCHARARSVSLGLFRVSIIRHDEELEPAFVRFQTSSLQSSLNFPLLDKTLLPFLNLHVLDQMNGWLLLAQQKQKKKLLLSNRSTDPFSFFFQFHCWPASLFFLECTGIFIFMSVYFLAFFLYEF